MALSTAERQARFRERKQQRLGQCVTPEDIVQAGRVFYHYLREQNLEPEDWDEHLAKCLKKRGGADWTEILPNDIRPDAYDWIEDAADRAFLEKVAAVVNAVLYPPVPK